MASLATALDTIITRENTLARENKLSQIGAMEAEKTQLAVDYHRHVRALKADPSRLHAAPDALRARLRAAIGSLESKLEDNTRYLGAAKEISEGIVAAAARAASEARAPTIGYAPKSTAKQRPLAATATIALDKRV
ncbi:hypothetical protein [Pyruvatibacter sp.]|uniref:hypothetical protein n=1 Tax=Pyruvatibacter sp. TaxID=1981328 RepID=UPI0032ECFFE5